MRVFRSLNHDHQINKPILLLFCLLISFLVFFITSKIFNILLISADDVNFETILSGALTGMPDGHCYFLSYPLSLIIASLYKINGAIQWYEWFLASCIILCLFLILARCTQLNSLLKRAYYIVFVLSFFFFCVIAFLVNLEWNATAGILSATAVFYYLTSLEETKLQTWVARIICLFLFLLSFGIRKQVFYMFIPLFAVCFLFRVLSQAEKNQKIICKENKKEFIFIAVFLLSIITMAVLTRGYYANAEWKAYAKFTTDRSMLFDYYGYPDYNTYQEIYQKEGISQSAFDLISSDYNYIIPLRDKGSDVFSDLSDISKKTYSSSIKGIIIETAENITTNFTSQDTLFINISLLIITVISILLGKSVKKSSLLISGAIGWGLCLFSYLAIKGRLPYRVATAIGFGVIAVSSSIVFIYLRETPYSKSSASFSRWDRLWVLLKHAVVCASIILLVLTNLYILYDNNLLNSKLAVQHKQIIQYCKDHPENIYLRDFNSYSQQGRFFNAGNDYFTYNYVSTGGWLYNTPIYREMAEMNDCQDIISTIREKENVYYLVNNEHLDDVINRLNTYFEDENIPITASLWGILPTVSENVNIIRFDYSN